MKSGESIAESIKDSTKVYQKIIGDNMKANMQNDYKNLGSNLKDYQNFIKKYKLETQRDVDDMILRMHDLYDNKEQTEAMIDNFRNAMDEMERSSRQTSDSIKSDISGWLNLIQLNSIANSLDNNTSTLMESTKRLQKTGSGTHDEVIDYRGFVKGLTDELNKNSDDGLSRYNLKDMYADIATLVENTNISRMDTLKEISRPTMLAYKSMNVSLESIADFTGKLYEYAGIDSLKSEGLLDYVKTISKGMNVNEQNIIDNMAALQNTILAQAKSNGLSNDETVQLLKDVASTTTYLDSIGVDSGYVMGLMKDFLNDPYGDSYKTLSLLTGMDSDSMKDMMLSEGGMQNFVDILRESVSEKYAESDDLGKSFMENYGIDFDVAQQMYLANDELINTIKSAMADNVNNPETMEEAVNDQAISYKESIENSFSTTIDILTDIREKIGISANDIIAAISGFQTIKNLLGKGSGSGGLLGKLFGKGTSTAANAGGSAAGAAGSGLLASLKGLGSSAVLNLGVLGESLITAGGGSAAGASIGSLAAAGAGSVAGGLLGGAGLISGGVDIYKAIKGKNKDGTEMSGKEKQDLGFTGGTKIGMVGTGAAAGAAIGSIIPGLGTLVGGLVGAGVGGIGALLGGKSAGKALSDLWDTTKEKAADVWDSVSNWGIETWCKIKDKASEDWGKIKYIGSSVFSKLKDDAFEKLSKIGDFIKDPISSIKDTVTETVDKFKTGISDAVTKFKEFKDDPIGTIKDAASNAWSNVKSFYNDPLGYIRDSLAGKDSIPSYDVGTNYVPKDQLAMVHEGEAIIPKKYNDDNLETLRRTTSPSNQYNNDENIEKLLGAISVLSSKVDKILETFNNYADDTEKRYKDDKLSSKIKSNRDTMYSRLYGLFPSNK